MALLRQVFKQCDISFLSKHCSVIRKNNWNIEISFSAKKVDVPSPPKRPLTAYMIFCKENRQELLKVNPSLSTPEQIKVLAAKWSNLSVDMKEPYEISARKCTLSYGEEHKKFYENLTDAQKGELARMKAEKKESRRLLKLKRELRESGLPKPAASAYAIFVQSQAKSKTGAKAAPDFIKVVAEKWKALSEDARKSFEGQAQADKKRHSVEMEKWRARLVTEDKIKLLQGYNELKGRGTMDQIPISKTSLKASSEKKHAKET